MSRVFGFVAVGGFVLLLLIAAVTSLGESARVESVNAAPAPAVPDHPDTWDSALAPYVAFVSANRGLEFTHPVAVEFLHIESALNESSEASQADFDEEVVAYFDDWSKVNTILGLTEPGQNPWTAATETQSAGAAAYYDPATDVIVLPLGVSGPELELSIVHELTHALQDQNGLMDGDLAYTEDQQAMNLALTEGDATVVETAWFNQMSAPDKRELQALWDSYETQLETDYFDASFAAPYILGEPVVQIMLQGGGLDALDAAQYEVFMTTEMLIDPLSATPTPLEAKKRYPDDTAPASASKGIAGAIGPLALYQALAPEIGASGAIEAVSGYDTDSFQLWSYEGRSCIDLRIWFDDAAEAAEFESLASGALGGGILGSSGVPKGPSLDYVLCDDAPIGDPVNQTVELLHPITLNNYLIAALLVEGLPEADVGCASLESVLALDAAGLANPPASLLDDARALAISGTCGRTEQDSTEQDSTE